MSELLKEDHTLAATDTPHTPTMEVLLATTWRQHVSTRGALGGVAGVGFSDKLSTDIVLENSNKVGKYKNESRFSKKKCKFRGLLYIIVGDEIYIFLKTS